jgi:hypothetical protein
LADSTEKSINTLYEFWVAMESELTIITMLCKMDDEIPTELRELIGNTWPAIKNKIEETRYPLNRAEVDDLAAVGLAGDSLKLKLKGFEIALNSKEHGRILRWTNIILGSL